jgi:hypothetical protein
MTTYANQNFFRVSIIHLFFGMLVLITPSSDLLFVRQIPEILGYRLVFRPHTMRHLVAFGNAFGVLKNTNESRVQIFATERATIRHTLKHVALSILQFFKGFLSVCIHLSFGNVRIIIRIRLQV